MPEILAHWKATCFPKLDVSDDLAPALLASAEVAARMRAMFDEGLSVEIVRARCLAAIDGCARSKHNQAKERRTLRAIFGSQERFDSLASLGFVPSVRKASAPISGPREKPPELSPAEQMHFARETLARLESPPTESPKGNST